MAEKIKYPITVRGDELTYGDVVQLFEGPYGSAVVKNVENGMVHFYRPYAHSDNVVMAGGVICYMGLEEFSRTATPRETYTLWRRDGHLQ